MNQSNCLIAVLLQCVLNLLGIKYGTPFSFNDGDIRTATLQDFCLQIAETTIRRNQYLIARADGTGQDGFQTTAGGGVYQIGLLVLGLEQTAFISMVSFIIAVNSGSN